MAGKRPSRRRSAVDASGATPAVARRSSLIARQAAAATLYDALLATYPDAHCELDFETPFQLLVATILSAQCTDKRVNMVTPALFARYPDAAALAAAPLEEVEELVRTTGFFRSKAKNLVAMAAALVADHGGEVPADMDALVRLPGVGRKTANVILGNAFGRNEGVVVDTHVARLGARLGLTREEDPVKIEADLAALFPRDRWTMLSHLLIFHGRRTCEARRPKCEACTVRALCPSTSV
ncbi:MAG TPA: endonuclease III [Gemmatimonadaceae bacterium]|nr:endonuclease III [Gemmatimonadaceae bacterium]